MTKLLRAAFALFLISGASFAFAEPAKSGCQSGGAKGVAQFAIQEAAGGYDLVLPPDLLARMPAKAEYKITIHDTTNKSETLTGTGSKVGANVLNVLAGNRFSLPTGRNSLLSLDVVALGINTVAGGSCSGCPRDASLQVYGDESICYCVH
ncbi:MAG: hypothetical protein CTY15_09440 [Methylocystis sp.]|nr:MAG: hypothetical protein CTY15_09440 [Methylocystis sp.]